MVRALRINDPAFARRLDHSILNATIRGMKTSLILIATLVLALPAIADPLYFMRPGGYYEIKAYGVSSTIVVKKISGEWVQAEVLKTEKTIWINMGLVSTVEELSRRPAKP